MRRIITISASLLSLALLAVSHTSAQTLTVGETASTQITVGEETVDGYSQIFYQTDGQKKYITKGSQNSHDPALNGNYIAFVKNIRGAGQIFLYHIPTEEVLQLTHTSTNLDPHVSGDGKVVWERWIARQDNVQDQTGTTQPSDLQLRSGFDPGSDSTSSAAISMPTNQLSATPAAAPISGTSPTSLSEGWQIVVFDGVASKQITQSGTANNPYIEDDVVVFAETEYGDNWTAKAYSVKENKTADISTGKDALYPKIDRGKILLGHQKNQQEFPLTTQDVLLLDLDPISGNVPQTVSEQEILLELQGL